MNLKTKIILAVIIIFSIGVFLYLSFKDDHQKTNVILITIDTLRADHLSTYGYGRKTSPAIDSLASDGILFKDAIVTLPKTSPSLASILSGLYPKTHKLFSLGFELDNAIQLLPEILKEKGYLTGGVCGQYNCNRKFGFKQGFDYYDDKFVYTYDKSIENVGGEFHPVSERRAQYVIEKSIEWIKKVKAKGDPSFTWIHLMDPHAAYDPPGKYGSFFSGSTIHTSNSFFGENIPPHLIHPQAEVAGVANYDYYLNRYDGEIRYMDSYLKKLFDFLKDNGLYDDTLIILTSDHGEYMGEQDSQIRYFSHGSTLLESEIRVPLIVKLPGNTSSNKKVSSHVSLVDIFPTIMDVVGEKDNYSEGRSLLTLIDNRELTDYSGTNFVQVYEGKTIAVRKGTYKLIIKNNFDILTLRKLLEQKKNINILYELFDFKNDPLERNNIAKDNMDIVRKLSSEFFVWLVSTVNDQGKDYSSEERTDEETLKHLKSLGYVN